MKNVFKFLLAGAGVAVAGAALKKGVCKAQKVSREEAESRIIDILDGMSDKEVRELLCNLSAEHPACECEE